MRVYTSRYTRVTPDVLLRKHAHANGLVLIAMEFCTFPSELRIAKRIVTDRCNGVAARTVRIGPGGENHLLIVDRFGTGCSGHHVRNPAAGFVDTLHSRRCRG